MVDDYKLAKKYMSLHASAAQRGIEFSLSLRHLRRLMSNKRCFYTNVELNDIAESPNKRTIDRIDASGPYSDKNTVACCHYFNNKKSNLTIEDINLLYKKINKLKIC